MSPRVAQAVKALALEEEMVWPRSEARVEESTAAPQQGAQALGVSAAEEELV